MKTKLLLAVIMMTLSFVSQAQNDELIQTYNFKDTSCVEEFSIYSNGEIKKIDVEIEGRIKDGCVLIEFVSPDGVIQDFLRLDADDENSNSIRLKGDLLTKEKAKFYEAKIKKEIENKEDDTLNILGILDKTVYNPQKGWWTVKMSPKSGISQVIVKYSIEN